MIIDMMNLQLKNYTKKDCKAIHDSIVRSLFRDARVTLKDLEDKERLKKKILAINKKADYRCIIDHSVDLLCTAKKFSDAKDYNKAKLFYATFFEHKLNRIIVELCERKSINKKVINDIIKSVNLIGKLTWLSLILDIPRISEKHKIIILKIADDRNAYVHYKHNPQPDDPIIKHEQKEIDELKQVERTVTYFKKYVSRILYNKRKTRLENKLRGK